jgi:hypothetical protein
MSVCMYMKWGWTSEPFPVFIDGALYHYIPSFSSFYQFQFCAFHITFIFLHLTDIVSFYFHFLQKIVREICINFIVTLTLIWAGNLRDTSMWPEHDLSPISACILRNLLSNLWLQEVVKNTFVQLVTLRGCEKYLIYKQKLFCLV